MFIGYHAGNVIPSCKTKPDFQCAVNHRFFGLSNFILGFYHQHIEVLEPEGLKAHLREEVGKMRF